MAAKETSILVLGAVLLFEPVNGYQLRRELLSWGVDSWGVNPGSIYSMLTTQAKRGYVRRHDLPDGHRAVAVYTSTPGGRERFDELVRDALVTVDLLHPLPFRTAASFPALVPREEYAGCLRERIGEIDRNIGLCEDNIAAVDRGRAPDHVAPMIEGTRAVLRTERRWLESFVARVDNGEFAFAGEPSGWVPPDDDPGWQMSADRERYRALLGR